MSRLVQAIKAGFLDPKDAKYLAVSGLDRKKLRGFLRHARHVAAYKRPHACKRPHDEHISHEPAAPNPRFLKTIAFTRAKAWAGSRGVPLAETKEVTVVP